jgi:hypothetical protein
MRQLGKIRDQGQMEAEMSEYENTKRSFVSALRPFRMLPGQRWWSAGSTSTSSVSTAPGLPTTSLTPFSQANPSWMDASVGPCHAHEEDTPGDDSYQYLPAQPGGSGQAGSHRGSCIWWPVGAGHRGRRSGDGPHDDGNPRLEPTRARRPPAQGRRDSRSDVAKRGNDIPGTSLSDRERGDASRLDPETASATNYRGAEA